MKIPTGVGAVLALLALYAVGVRADLALDGRADWFPPLAQRWAMDTAVWSLMAAALGWYAFLYFRARKETRV